MFKLVPKESRTFRRDVPVMVPIDGGFRTETLVATFRFLEQNEVMKFDLSKPDATTAFLQAAIARFDHVSDENDKPLQYSDELRDRLLEQGNVRLALINDYFDAVTKAKAGN